MLQKKKRNIEKRNNMKIIDQSYEICKTHGYTLQDVYKDIERAARVSYKSEDKITEDSAEKMVQRLISMKHYSPLEFGTIYLKAEIIPCWDILRKKNINILTRPWVYVENINKKKQRWKYWNVLVYNH